MLVRLIAMLVGFGIACVATALTMVLFVVPPSELIMPGSPQTFSRIGMWSLLAGTQHAIFAAPFALVGAAIGEWRAIRDWSFYALIGVAIAVVGFLAQYQNEAPGAPTIVNNYALMAFLSAGLVGGLVYWLLTGRSAGGRSRDPHPIKPVVEVMPPGKIEPRNGNA
jgi:uncharacterized membrane protein